MKRIFYKDEYYDYWEEHPDKESALKEVEVMKKTGIAKATKIVKEKSRFGNQNVWVIYYIPMQRY
jgi:hypothetical protein